MVDINGEQTLSRLRAFNRKERGFLIANAVSNQGSLTVSKAFLRRAAEALLPAGKAVPESESVRESADFWTGIATSEGGNNSASVLVAMDYHLDWFATALYAPEFLPGEEVASDKPVCNNHVKDVGCLMTGNQEDVDLLLADLDDNGKLHILMIEAKFDGSWKWDQLASKLDRLTKVLKPINAATLNLQLLLAQPKKLRSPLTVHWDEEGRLPISWPKKGTKEGRRLEKALRTLQVSEGGRVNCLAGWEFSVEKVKAPTIPLRPGHLPIVAPSRMGKDHEELRFKSLHFVDPDTSC